MEPLQGIAILFRPHACTEKHFSQARALLRNQDSTLLVPPRDLSCWVVRYILYEVVYSFLFTIMSERIATYRETGEVSAIPYAVHKYFNKIKNNKK